MMPVGASGERAPALAPLTIMRVIRKGLMRVSAQSAIPMGASTTVVAMLPGPMAASTTERTKKMMGSMPTTPRDPLTAHLAIFSTVPLMVAMLKSSVAPDEDHEEPQGEELVEVRHLHDAARRHGDEKAEGDAHDADVALRDTADDNGDEQRHQGEDAQKLFLGHPAPEHAAQVVAPDDEAGCNEQQSEQQIPLQIHKDSLRLR